MKRQGSIVVILAILVLSCTDKQYLPMGIKIIYYETTSERGSTEFRVSVYVHPDRTIDTLERVASNRTENVAVKIRGQDSIQLSIDDQKFVINKNGLIIAMAALVNDDKNMLSLIGLSQFWLSLSTYFYQNDEYFVVESPNALYLIDLRNANTTAIEFTDCNFHHISRQNHSIVYTSEGYFLSRNTITGFISKLASIEERVVVYHVSDNYYLFNYSSGTARNNIFLRDVVSQKSWKLFSSNLVEVVSAQSTIR